MHIASPAALYVLTGQASGETSKFGDASAKFSTKRGLLWRAARRGTYWCRNRPRRSWIQPGRLRLPSRNVPQVNNGVQVHARHCIARRRPCELPYQRRSHRCRCWCSRQRMLPTRMLGKGAGQCAVSLLCSYSAARGEGRRTGAGRLTSHAGRVVVGRAVVARRATSHSSLVGHRVQGAGCRVAKRSIATVSKRTARDISAQWARGERVPTQKSPLPWDVRPAGHAVEQWRKRRATREAV